MNLKNNKVMLKINKNNNNLNTIDIPTKVPPYDLYIFVQISFVFLSFCLDRT